jgi:fatty-acyl-CoA synthase
MNTGIPLVPSYWEDLTLVDLLEYGAANYDGTALRYHGKEISFDKLDRRCRAAADGLRAQGVRPGDRVAVLIEDRPEWVYTVFGTALAGAVPVFLSTGYSVRELRHAIDVTGTSVLVAQDETDHGSLLTTYGQLFFEQPDVVSEATLDVENSVANVLTTVVEIDPVGERSEAIGFDALLDEGRDVEGVPSAVRSDIDPDDRAAILFTSGTTSMPKAAVRTHRNLVAHAVDMGNWYDRSEGDELLDLFPNPSITATNQLLMSLAHGCRYELLDHYDPDLAVERMAKRNLNWIAGVDTMFKDLLDEDLDELDFGAVDRVALALVGGIDPDLGERIEETFEAPIENPYGMTETNAFLLRSRAGQPFEVRLHPGGQPGYKTGVKVDIETEDADGTDEGSVEGSESEGEKHVGELRVKGITVTPGYYNNERATEGAFDRNGWLHTDDVATLREHEFGYTFHFSGRLDDMFQVGGNNVAPAEVESCIAERDDISWAGVVGIPHDRLGSVPAAFITVEDGHTVTPETVTEYCGEQLASYKVPRTVFVIEPDEIPVKEGVNGKKLRRDRLREMVVERK